MDLDREGTKWTADDFNSNGPTQSGRLFVAFMNVDQSIQLAVQHQQSGRFADAEQVYRQILERFPEHADAWHLRGILAGQAGRANVAVDFIGRAIRLRPDVAEYHSNLGNALRSSGRIDDAIAACRQAVQLQPDLAPAHCQLANTLKTKGDLEAAIAEYREAVRLLPGYAQAYNNLGSTLSEQEKFRDAIAEYQRALAINPNYVEALSNLGLRWPAPSARTRRSKSAGGCCDYDRTMRWPTAILAWFSPKWGEWRKPSHRIAGHSNCSPHPH